MKCLCGIIVVLSFFQINSNAQTFWKNYYPVNPGTDDLRACDANGNGYYFVSFGPGIIVGKTDNSGNLLWNKRVSVDSCTINYPTVTYTNDGGCIIHAFLDSTGSSQSTKIILIKIDSTGSIVWFNRYTMPTPNSITLFGLNVGVAQLYDSNMIVLSESLSGVSLMKIDQSGNVLWARSYHPISAQAVVSTAKITQTSDSGFIFLLRPTPPQQGYSVDILVKADKDGNLLWNKSFVDTETTQPNGGLWGDHIIEIPNVGYAFTFGQHFIKTDLTGDTIWTRSYEQNDHIKLIYNDYCADGGFVLAAEQLDTNSHQFIDLFKISANGSLLWTKNILNPITGTSNVLSMSGLTTCSDEGFLIAGGTAWMPHGMMLKTDSTGAYNCQINSNPIIELNLPLLSRLDTVSDSTISVVSNSVTFQTDTGIIVTDICSLNSITKYDDVNEIRIFPNPANDEISFQSVSEMQHISITDISGRIIFTTDPHSTDIQVDIKNFPSAIYFLEINTNEGLFIRKLIVQ